MHISPIYSTNLNKPQNKNVSMKGLDPMTLIISRIIRMGVAGVQDIQRSSKKASLLRRLIDDSYSNFLDDMVPSYQAISKLPDSFYTQQGFWDTYVPILSHIRQDFIKRLSQIPDSRAELIHTKKDFINSLFNNGHEITIEFRDCFSELNDNCYRSFKQEIMDKCFFSPQFNSMRKNCASICHKELYEHINDGGYFRDRHPEHMIQRVTTEQRAKATGQAYCNLKLLATLDRDLYKPYFNARASIINKNKDYLKNRDDFCYFKPYAYDELIGPLLDL